MIPPCKPPAGKTCRKCANAAEAPPAHLVQAVLAKLEPSLAQQVTAKRTAAGLQ